MPKSYSHPEFAPGTHLVRATIKMGLSSRSKLLCQQHVVSVQEKPSDTLREHGLDPPRGSVELQRRDQPPLLILIGARNPPATGVYVRVGADGPAALTGALLLWDLEKVQRAFGAAE